MDSSIPTDLQGRRVAVTGAQGFLGKHLLSVLAAQGAQMLPVKHSEYDLLEQTAVRRLYAELQPEILIHAAGAVGGLGANVENPGRFLYENAMMGLMLIDEGRKAGLRKFVLVSTVCAYPEAAGRDEGGVMREDMLWDGRPSTSIASYGLAKRMLHETLSTYHRQYGFASAVLVLTNLYGPHDHFGAGGHMVPMVVARYCDAVRQGLPSVTNWGTGRAVRDWVYVGDAARAICLAAASTAAALTDGTPINIGSGEGHAVRELCDACGRLAGFAGEVLWDATKPDGIARRYCDTTRAKQLLGFEPEVSLEEGLRRTIEWYRTLDAPGTES
uniref:GDP-L-fucose synthase n=1 Tax=Eutreptiella gymnastica TaxID=73025 RepID=A0A7S4LG10_9EUGL